MIMRSYLPVLRVKLLKNCDLMSRVRTEKALNTLVFADGCFLRLAGNFPSGLGCFIIFGLCIGSLTVTPLFIS